MTRRQSASRELLGGSARVFLAESVALPAGLITAAFLARRLGPGGYGVFTLTMAIVAWVEWTLASLLARAAVKVISDAEDWRPAGAAALRFYAASGVIGFVAMWLAAGPLELLMHEPGLAAHVRLIAFDVPLFMLSQAHQQVLVGTGQYERRAIVGAWRWTARVALIVGFVLGGLSIDGALAGVVAATAIELVVARRFVRPGFSHASHVEAKAMWNYALPLFAAAASLRLFDKLDLFVLKALGGSATLAGVYGAAQNLTIIPNLVALSVTTLLLSTLSRALRMGDTEGARQLATNAIRGVLVLFPFAGVAAGAATGLATLIYGSAFADTGPLLAVLIFAALVVVMISVASSILTAIGKPTWVMWATLPIAPLALAGHLMVIPRFGATGATYVTLVVAAIGAVAALFAVHRAWHVTPPVATAFRVTLVTAAAAVAGAWWRTSGIMVVVELAAMSVAAIALLAALGERAAVGSSRRESAVLGAQSPID